MNEVVESLERHEHASHHAMGATGIQWAALLVAVLAAGLAIAEQGARHAEIKVQQNSIDTADTWAQYQAKSIRATVARDAAMLAGLIDVGADPAAIKRRDDVLARLKSDLDGYDNDPKDGRPAIANRAHEFEHRRDHAMEQTHAYHNGSASFQLGIVLATASAITKARPLLFIAAALGVVGVVLSVLGYVAPALGAL